MALIPRVKICGLTRLDQALAIADLGVDAIGFILYPPSPRYIEPDKIKEIIKGLPPFVKTVGVVVNESIEKITELRDQTGLDLIQLSGDEDTELINQLTSRNIPFLKTVRVKEAADVDKIKDYSVNAVLLDAWSDTDYGGTGKSFDWNLIKPIKEKFQVILAGGIKPENVIEAVRTVSPYAIDVSSGVEIAPGNKSIGLVEKLLENLNQAF